MNAPICCASVQKTASEPRVFAEIPEFGHGDTAERPIAEPKVRNTNDKRGRDYRAGDDRTPFDKSEASSRAGSGPTCTIGDPFTGARGR